MKKFGIFACLLTFGLAQNAFCAPPEVVGTYIGIVKEGSLDHETGKKFKEPSAGIEIKVQANDTITYKYINAGITYTGTNCIVGKSNFTFRLLTGPTHLLIKGKFTGKGKKLKANYYWSNPTYWYEGNISAKKI